MMEGKTKLVAAVVVALALTMAWPVRGESASVMLQKGIFAEQTAGDLDKAIGIYRKILDDARANRKYVAEAQYRLGVCLLKKGRREEAAAAFRELVARYPEQKALVAKARKQMPQQPFPEFVGCRVKEQLALEVRLPGSRGAFRPTRTIHEFSHLQITWRVDPEIAGRAKSFAVAVHPNVVEKPTAGAIWQAANLPATARRIAYGEAPGAADKPAPELKRGEYLVNVYAFEAPQDKLDPRKAIGLAAGILKVEPLIYTQIQTSDVQPDGTIRFRSIMQRINTSSEPLTEKRFMNSDFVRVTRMTDDKGRPLKFSVSHRQRAYHYRVTFNEPVAPGEAVLQSSEGTMTGLVRRTGDVWRYYMRHHPGSSRTRRIEVYRLPQGAELLDTVPSDMPRRTRNGRIELLAQKIIPPRGSITTSFRYRLAGAKPLELSHDDGTAEGKMSLAGSGHIVAFECPGDGGKVVAVKIFASRYGYPRPPDEDFHVYLLDADKKVLGDFKHAYGRIARGEQRWYTLANTPTAVPKRFFVALSFNPHRTKGIYVGYDKDVRKCHSFVGLPSTGFAMVREKYDWMVRVHLAREAPATQPAAGDLKLIPPPWKDGEATHVVVQAPGGAEMGKVVYSVCSASRGEKKVWRMESSMVVTTNNMRHHTRVDADAKSFAPLFGRTNNSLMGDFSAAYSPGKAERAMGGRPQPPVTVDEPVFDNEQVLFLIRRLPLATGYRASIPIFPVLTGATGVVVPIEVTGTEKVTVPAGTFDCYKLSLSLYAGPAKTVEHTLWISADAKRYLVKYDARSGLMLLEKVETRKATAASKFFHRKLGVILRLPAGWYAYRRPASGDERTKVDLFGPDPGIWGMFVAAAKGEGDTSARRFAGKDAQRIKGFLKEYAVRPQSWEELKVSGLPAARYVADYKEEGKDKVEYRTYLLGKSAVYWFVFRTDRAALDAQKKFFDSFVAGFKG